MTIPNTNLPGNSNARVPGPVSTSKHTHAAADVSGVQPLDAELSAIAGLTSAADKGIQFTGAGTAATFDLTSAGKALLDDANADAQLVTLGGGTPEGSGVLVRKTSPTLVTPNIGAAVGTSLAATGDLTSSGGGIGYAAGNGGQVTQLTSKATGVTLDERSGRITMNNAALAAGAEVTFVVTNSTFSNLDTPILSIVSGATLGAYNYWVASKSNGSFRITLSNVTGGSLSEAVVIDFLLLKGAIT